jgi:hypothetical protein
MSNSIILEKRIQQNLICNRLSHQVSIQWLKVNLLDVPYLNLKIANASVPMYTGWQPILWGN